MSDVLDLTAAQALERISSGDLGADEYFDGYAQVAASDDLNAYLWRAEGGSNGAADGPLGGAPVAVKDIFCTEGVETTAGSRILEGYRPPYTATAVRRLAEAGGRVLGKTNMDEFAMGSSNENSAYGPVRNPWDRDRVPGGSSGGSAAAVAGRLAPWAIGTDTGGSIRQPASLCGVVGLKPTYGAISRYGMIAFASSLDQCGTLTRDTTDAALLLRAMEGRDPCDSTSVGIEGGVELPSRTDLKGLRFGIPRELSSDAEGLESGVTEVFERAVGLIRDLGAEVDECELPHAAHGLSAYYVLAPAEASANLARYDGVRYGLRAGVSSDAEGGLGDGIAPADADLLSMYERTREAGFGPEVKRRIMLGTYALSSGYYEAYYGRAQRVRTKIAQDFATAFERFDYLVTPTSPTVAFALGARAEDPLAMYMSDYCTVPMSLAGLPAISLPAGLAESPGGGTDLPVGLQIVAPAFGESGLLDAAHAVEGAIGFDAEPGGRVVTAGGYEPVIGLEIHVQLSTATKMFCGCALSFGDEPNVHTCPVCLAHPGSLPVVNERAVSYALQIALALECDVAPRSIFHRKNYFYPDNPKGYQISQYDIPLATEGTLGDVRIHRVHLEEDAAKMIHVGRSGRIHGSAHSLVDFNRGGTPLVEIVTEPDLSSPAEAREWAQLLRTTVKQLGVSDVNMEEGSLRIDANVSIRPEGTSELGTKTELKNMNSFRFLERGIAAELERQQEVLEGGGEVVQETFHFDPRTGSLTPLRSKEYAHDYRYFPEPDLVPLAPTEEMLSEARAALPELPAKRRERYEAELGLPEVTARQLAFDAELGEYFERALEAGDGAEPRTIANWVTGELVARLREAGDGEADPASSNVTPRALAALAGMVEAKRVTTGAARQVLATLVSEGGEPGAIVEREGLAQMSDSGELEGIVAAAIEAEPAAAEKARSGNPKAIGPIVGAVMRETKGRADGGEVTRLIREQLGL